MLSITQGPQPWGNAVTSAYPHKRKGKGKCMPTRPSLLGRRGVVAPGRPPCNGSSAGLEHEEVEDMGLQEEGRHAKPVSRSKFKPALKREHE